MRELNREDLSYSADANGYMLYYKTKPIGGAGVKLPREKPLHWRHARQNRADNQTAAQDEIENLLSGRGQARLRAVIEQYQLQEGLHKDDIRTPLKLLLAEYGSRCGCTTTSAFRDLLTEVRHLCNEGGYNFEDISHASLEVYEEELASANAT